MRNRRMLLWLGSVLILGGAAVLATFCFNSFHSISEQRQAREWLNSRERIRANPAPPRLMPPAVLPSPSRGDVLGELTIPRLHLSVMVFEGDDNGILKIGAGHIPGTPLPPHDGNICIAAHRDTFFRPLRAIHANDLVTLRTPFGITRFAVTETEIVLPSRIDVLAQAHGRDLTLVTCYPFSYIGHAPQRFIIHAKKIG